MYFIRLLKSKLTELSEVIDFLIYGSYANGTNNSNSDLDIVIFSKKTKKVLKILSKFNKATHQQFITLEEFEQLHEKNNRLIIKIMKNHVLFGNFKKFIRLMMR